MTELTLTSANLRWGLDAHDEPYDLEAALRGFDTDVVCLQELWIGDDQPDRLDELARELGYDVLEQPMAPSFLRPRPEITARPDEAHGTWGIALLTRRPIRRWRVVDLGRMVERWDVAHRRALVAELDVDGVPIVVATVHLSFSPLNAAGQLRRLRGALPPGRASIVVGDCNLWGPPAAALLGGHRRAVRGRTWPARRPHSQLDHILVSPEIEVRAAAVGDPIGSDHLPVQARLGIATVG
ncbi:MAG: endonuclease/exonuclease/phosphatase family protein [Acidimicrobiales bacterium]|nr:endonuclease/exonuclease/phosphatase family protein [Acidimicrobiales bacterium]HRW37079.1 endonuclease/exonuclease/phosphatase family protein [Aquihabitans sp.]